MKTDFASFVNESTFLLNPFSDVNILSRRFELGGIPVDLDAAPSKISSGISWHMPNKTRDTIITRGFVFSTNKFKMLDYEQTLYFSCLMPFYLFFSLLSL